MSYIRAGYPLEYVHGISEDYVYPTSEGQDGTEYIEDYGSISNNGIIEILCRHWQTGNKYDELLKWKIIKYLAEKLHVPLKEEYKKKGEKKDEEKQSSKPTSQEKAQKI